MARIRIKDNKYRERNRRNKLWKALMATNISTSRLEEVKHNFDITIKDEAIEHATSPQTRNILRSYGFDPMKPHYLNAKKTVVVKHVDVHIADSTGEDIITSIKASDDRLEVEEVIHLPTSSKTIKIKFATIRGAKIALNEGLTILNQIIPSKNISEEIYIQLIPCFVCFQYDHKTTNCPTPNYRVCSECGKEGHLYTECPNPNPPRCINCGKAHRTLAAVCSIRKDIIKKRTKEIIEKRKTKKPTNQDNNPNQEHTSNNQDQDSQSNKETSRITRTEEHEQPLPKNASAIIMSAIIFATMHEAHSPGTYQDTINETYKLNGIPPVKLPKPKNPKEFLRSMEGSVGHTQKSTTENEDQIQEQCQSEASNQKSEEGSPPRRRRKRKINPTKLSQQEVTVTDLTSESVPEVLMEETTEDIYIEENDFEQFEESSYLQNTSFHKKTPELSEPEEETHEAVGKHAELETTLKEETEYECEDDTTENTSSSYNTSYESSEEEIEGATGQDPPKAEPPANPDKEFVVWKERDYQYNPRTDLFRPQSLGVKLIGIKTCKPPYYAPNEDFYQLYDKKKLALVVEDAEDIPFVLQCMDEQIIDFVDLKIRFYSEEKFYNMVEGIIPFTWNNE